MGTWRRVRAPLGVFAALGLVLSALACRGSAPEAAAAQIDSQSEARTVPTIKTIVTTNAPMSVAFFFICLLL